MKFSGQQKIGFSVNIIFLTSFIDYLYAIPTFQHLIPSEPEIWFMRGAMYIVFSHVDPILSSVSVRSRYTSIDFYRYR